MNITNLIENLPDDIKMNVIDFTNVRLKNHREAVRVTLDIELSDDMVNVLKNNKHIVGAGLVACYRYAPEIKHSYFYVV